MARHKDFDLEAATTAAIKVFARHGFEGTSTNDLLDAMGIAVGNL
jgi:TetR/AcrR family transcriptional regulator, transcriptional repressor for nem operon